MINIVHAYFKKRQPQIDTNIDLKQTFANAIKTKNVDDSLKYAAHLYKSGQLEYIIETLKTDGTERVQFNEIYSQFKEARKTTIDRYDLLFLVNMILNCVMKSQDRITEGIEELSLETVKNIYAREKIVNFPDWTYDKHTAEGARLGRKMKHFYEVAAVLVNCFIPDPYEPIAKANNTIDEV